MSKIVNFWICFLVIGLSTAFCQVEEMVQPSVSEVRNTDQLDKSLLWEISGKELEKPSYLYGTIHMIGKEDFFLTDATKKAFDKSEKVTFEINMEEMNNIGTLFSLLGQVMMNDGVSLKDLLSEDDYDFITEKFADIGLPLVMLEKVKPMFLSALATGEGGPDGMATGEIVSYEMEFMQMAQTQEKTMDGLETIEYQMSMFDSIPYQVQADMLVESFKPVEDVGSDQFAEMVALYKSQDIEGMQVMFEGDTDGLGKYEDLLLGNRNRNWIPVMEKQMKEQVTFFAVGAGHLGGDQGVIRLLQDAGYTVKALK